MDTRENSSSRSTARRVKVGRSAPLDESTKARIYRQYLQGTSLEALSDQLGLASSATLKMVNAMRANRILELKITAIPHGTFDDPKAAAEILATPEARATRKIKAPDGLSPYLRSLYDAPLLSREQETHLFRKMNYLKYQASKLCKTLDPTRATTTVLDEIDRLMESALAVKNELIRSNLRLVVSIAKKHVDRSDNFFELISDGNMSLIRAVEKYDFARGNKFSTYASWAIIKNFIRSIPVENHRRDRFVTGHGELFEAAADNRSDEHEYERAQKRLRDAVKSILGQLDARERRIIISRFGLDGAREQTLESLGKELGITKERVRQLEARAQGKLRKIAVVERLEAPVY